MYEYNINFVDKITKLPTEQRDNLWKWITTQSEPVKIEAFKMMIDYLHRKPPAGIQKHKVEYIYSALISVFRDMNRIETKDALKRGMKIKEALKLSDIRIERMKANKWKRKKKVKSELIRKRYLSEIKRMREKKLSWRDIAKYLKKYHHLKISHGYLQRIFNKYSKKVV